MAVSLRLPEDLSARLDKLAKRTGRSKTYHMIGAIRELIGDLGKIGDASLFQGYGGRVTFLFF